MHPAVKVNIENQNELGTDIYCNCVAAYLEFQMACVVVDFGTALTFTGIDDFGEIQGVAIAPGLKTAIKSLFTNTAQLPEVPLELPVSALGKNTVTAIQSGILYGYEGMVKNMTAKFKAELGEYAKVYVTGGLSSIIPGVKEFTTKTDMDLTLRGLLEIGKNFRGNTLST
jgi:type III pantothenate kinase